MLFEPTLKVNRLVVYRSREVVAYDETFHDGINIIRGENAHGKSTVLNLLIHGLGADKVTFNNDSLSCSHTYVEILINSTPLTLRREISDQSQRPMLIFWGVYEEALRSSPEKWEAYPYRSTDKKESFSQVLFNALGFPEIKTSLSSKITIHQLLRIICKDQMAPVYKIFKTEQFDASDLREEVGGLLCGYNDDRLYELRLELRTLRERKKELTFALKSINPILSYAGEIPDIIKINKTIEKLSKNRGQLHLKLQAVHTRRPSPTNAGNKKIKVIDIINERLKDTSVSISYLKKKLNDLVFELKDSEEFITYLESNLDSIKASETTVRSLGSIDFETCPACYGSIGNEEKNLCPLCRNEFDKSIQSKNILRIKQELSYQIAESKKLQKDRLEGLEIYDGELCRLNKEQKELQIQLEESILPSPGLEAESNRLSQEIGGLDNEIVNLEKLLLLAEKLEEIKQEISSLAGEIEYIAVEENKIEMNTRQRKVMSKKAISQIVLDSLKRDIDEESIPYEEKFKNVVGVEFSFNKDYMSIKTEGETGIEEHLVFAASSHVILKNSFHLALLVASCQHGYFRYPRFLIIDSIEDKGMESARSHCFQKNIVEISESLDVNHQIIFSTAEIAPELDIEEYTVGDYYKGNKKSLHLGTASGSD